MISTMVRKEVMGEGINDVSFVTGDSFFVSQPVKLLFPQQLMDPAGVISTLQITFAGMTSCFTEDLVISLNRELACVVDTITPMEN